MKTIVAVSTPFGKGGIAVIRISGADAVGVAEKMFFPRSGASLSSVKANFAIYGEIASEGTKIDDGVAVVFRAPRSYTGEDTVEISCHGGILLTERVLKTAFDCGATPAGPGEFTQRAFLNGKLALTEAEAVIGLIDAENEQRLKLCASHTSGVLSRRLEALQGEIMKLLSSVYVGLDYPEEDLEEVSNDEFRASLEHISAELKKTCATYREGKAVSEGIKTVLLGKPNTGKSSLLNALLGEERAIVTDIPGTTRDVIEESVTAGKIILRLSDTAGLRQSCDEVESIGISRALEKARDSDLIIAMFDGSRKLDCDDDRVIEALPSYISEGKTVICAINKSDLEQAFGVDELAIRVPAEAKILTVCADNGDGVETLKNVASECFVSEYSDYTSVAVIANARQFSALSRAKECVDRCLSAFDSGFGSDVCGLDLEEAAAFLGELDGRAVSDSVVDMIFHNFCVGK